MSQIHVYPTVSFGLPLKALSVTAFSEVQALQEFLQDRANPQSVSDVKEVGRLYIFGGGSNILPIGFLDAHLILPQFKGIEYEDYDADSVIVTAASGENWHDLVLDSIDKGYSGLENLSLIPGNVGAAPIQNIGAYGVELADRLIEVHAIDIRTGMQLELSHDECDFDYRNSIFKTEMKGHVIITGISLRLDKKPNLNLSYGALAKTVSNINSKPNAKDVSDAVISIRQSKLPDPNKIGNAGSFFKNPVVTNEQYTSIKAEHPEIVAYEQEDGFKVMVNHGDASGEEILAVASTVQRQVYNKFNVLLEPEVQIIGDKNKIQESGLIFPQSR